LVHVHERILASSALRCIISGRAAALISIFEGSAPLAKTPQTLIQRGFPGFLGHLLINTLHNHLKVCCWRLFSLVRYGR
jgi:hypothetical protein